MCAVECLDLIFLIIINTHARNTLLNICAREERSDKFILLIGLKLVNADVPIGVSITPLP